MKSVLLAATIAMASSLGAATAKDAPYLDDRSDAATLVRSLYNAINRHEYARAWDYFGESKPSRSFAAFVEGYKTTARVDVATGTVTEEGAAGSTFYQVPLAIKAVAADGSETIYAGCYTARRVNPQIQEPPFQPIHLEKGSLTPADGILTEAVPASCGTGPAPTPHDTALEQVKAAFAASYSNTCDSLAPDAEDDAAKPEVSEISYRYTFGSADDPETKVRLVAFLCRLAAYNSVEVYYLIDETGDIQQLQFPTPELDIKYENDNSEGKVLSTTIIGYTAEDTLLNSSYDPTTKSITAFAKWRGVGDASSSGIWVFRNGKFSLQKYDVDASYDGEINEETIVDYGVAP